MGRAQGGNADARPAVARLLPGAGRACIGLGTARWETHAAMILLRHGQSEFNLHFTQTLEVIPSKTAAAAAPGQKRRLDTVLIRYVIENKDSKLPGCR